MDPSLGLPLQGGMLQSLPSNASADQIVVVMNELINRLNNQLQLLGFSNGSQQIIQLGFLPGGATGFKLNDKNGVGLALFGIYPDGSIALKVAKANEEVTTASNDQLIFNSEQDIFKIVSSNLVTVNVPASGGAGSSPSVGTYSNFITFDPTQYPTGSYPMVLATVIPPYVTASDAYVLGVPFTSFDSSSNFEHGASYTIGTNTIEFNIDIGVATSAFDVGDWTFKYFLLQETSS